MKACSYIVELKNSSNFAFVNKNRIKSNRNKKNN